MGSNEGDEGLNHSRVVVIRNMLVLENMKTRHEFYEVEDDVYEECRQYGRIREIIIPKPGHLNYRKLIPLHI